MDRRSAIKSFVAASVAVAAMPGVRAATIEPGSCGPGDVPDFARFCFTDDAGVVHPVYVTGTAGPPVILLHELPGLIRHDLQAAVRIARLNYRVIAPLFFGTPGQDSNWWRTFRYARRYCGNEQFACGEKERTSPHVGWLRQLCRAARDRWPEGRGVGVIGMCLTGAFPVALLQEKVVRAAIVCQPTVPFHLFTRVGWFTDFSALGLDPSDLARAKGESDAAILGLRYTDDPFSRAPRFRRLAEEFQQRFYRLDLVGDGHSTLGQSACDHAFAEVESFLNATLRLVPDSSVASFPIRSRPASLVEVPAPGCADSHATAHR